MLIAAYDPRLAFGLLENAMDSLAKGSERFARRQTPRDLKFAVLSITHACELFLKVRLAKEHPLLLFPDPGRIGAETPTVDLRSAVDRLRAAGVGIDGYQELEPLKRLRNRLQHYEFDESEAVVIERVGLELAVKFPEQFLEREIGISLKDKLSSDAYFVVHKAGLKYDAALQLALRKRDDDLAALSEGSRRHTQVLECDFCGQQAVLYPNPGGIPRDHVRCYFCDERHVVVECRECRQMTVTGDPCDVCSRW